jgi:hypothetical protein
MKKTKVAGLIIFCSLPFSFSPFLFAQTKQNEIGKMQIVFRGNHLVLNFCPLYSFKAHIKERSGHYPFSASATPGFLLSFKYQINFNNYYSLLTGTGSNTLRQKLYYIV